jgi:hypothetical protein
MTQRSRGRMLIKAVHDAAIELATRAYLGQYPPTPMPDEPVVMARVESATEGPYLDDKRPTPDEIRAFTEDYLDVTDPDELWTACAINTLNETRHPGAGRTAAEAKTCAWVYSHSPRGAASALVKVSTKVPEGWTFELYPPPKPKQMIAISALAIFELVRLTVPNVTPDEVSRLSATYQQGLLTLQRKRTGGSQHVTVKHIHQQVNVTEGGQAVVAGDTVTRGPGERRRGIIEK